MTVDLPDDNVPKEIRDAVQAAIDANPGDIDQEIADAQRRVRKLRNFRTFVDNLVSYAVKKMVWDLRHQMTRGTKAAAKQWDAAQAKKRPNDPPENLDKIFMGVFVRTKIGGHDLGDILGKDIPALVAAEKMLANGHLLNAELLEWCEGQGVTGDVRVSDVITERKMWTKIQQLTRKYGV